MQFLVELYAPRDDAALREIERRAAAVVRAARAIAHLQTIVVPEDETCFVLFDAESAEALAAATSAAGLGDGRILSARSLPC